MSGEYSGLTILLLILKLKILIGVLILYETSEKENFRLSSRLDAETSTILRDSS
jgi:hypothetical protein